jgi:Tfp pilus assembly protein PilF
MPMKAWRRILIAAWVVAALGACAPGSVTSVFRSSGEADLNAGISSYENGKYAEAAKSLQSALDAGLGKSDQVKAHKYLAFIYCASGREKQCRDEFGKALEINPGLELEPAEAGHPVWGPVFRSVKTRR